MPPRRHEKVQAGLTHPCGGFLSSQPALMTGVMGVEPPGSSSMRCGGKSGVRLSKGWFRPLVGHPPLGQEKGRAARLGLPEATARQVGRLMGSGKEGSRMGGYSLGDTLIVMVILIFGIVPRQLLSLAQQTSHPHSPRDSAWQGLLLAPQGHPLSVTFSPHPQSHPLTATPVYSILSPHNSALLLLFPSVSAPFPRSGQDHTENRGQGQDWQQTLT